MHTSSLELLGSFLRCYIGGGGGGGGDALELHLSGPSQTEISILSNKIS